MAKSHRYFASARGDGDARYSVEDADAFSVGDVVFIYWSREFGVIKSINEGLDYPYRVRRFNYTVEVGNVYEASDLERAVMSFLGPVRKGDGTLS